MGIVDEAVEDGVGVGWIADHLVPCRYRQLAGDDRRAAPVAFLEDFEQVVARPGVERFEPPVVEDEQLDAADFGKDSNCGPVAAAKLAVAR